MAYMHGNLALQPKKKQEQKAAVQQSKRTVVRKKSIPVQEKLIYLFTIVVCVIVASVIIFRYAQIYQLNLQIKELTTHYNTMSVEMTELQKQVETLSDPGRIRDEAIQTGMVPSGQSILVEVGEDASQTAMKR
jgi:cell division protein FtsL